MNPIIPCELANSDSICRINRCASDMDFRRLFLAEPTSLCITMFGRQNPTLSEQHSSRRGNERDSVLRSTFVCVVHDVAGAKQRRRNTENAGPVLFAQRHDLGVRAV